MTFEENPILKNQARLNSKDLKELKINYIRNIKLLHGGIVEFDNWEDFKFQYLNNSHDTPLNGVKNDWRNRKTSIDYLGFRVWMKGKWLKLPKKDLNNSFFNEIDCFSTQNGFHTGTFNGGEYFLGEFRIYLDDFPLIKSNILNIVSEREINRVFKTEREKNLFVRRAKLDIIFESTL
jgi:hypothetical protein